MRVKTAVLKEIPLGAGLEAGTWSSPNLQIRMSQFALAGAAARFASAMKVRLQAWPRRYRVEAEGLGLSFWPLARLAQNEERGCTGREARSGRRLGQMSRRKFEITAQMNERDFPHLVELEWPELAHKLPPKKPQG